MSAAVPSVFLVLMFALAGCVAPEEPPTPRPSRVVITPQPSAPAAGSAGFSDAPIPNRKIGTPADASVIRLKK